MCRKTLGGWGVLLLLFTRKKREERKSGNEFLLRVTPHLLPPSKSFRGWQQSRKQTGSLCFTGRGGHRSSCPWPLRLGRREAIPKEGKQNGLGWHGVSMSLCRCPYISGLICLGFFFFFFCPVKLAFRVTAWGFFKLCNISYIMKYTLGICQIFLKTLKPIFKAQPLGPRSCHKRAETFWVSLSPSISAFSLQKWVPSHHMHT